MKKIVEDSKDEICFEQKKIQVEGLELFLGQRVTIMCQMYFYTGRLMVVTDKFVKLEDAYIVYDTGELSSDKWERAEKIPNDWYVMNSCIESFGLLK